jgi:hypothetical protein
MFEFKKRGGLRSSAAPLFKIIRAAYSVFMWRMVLTPRASSARVKAAAGANCCDEVISPRLTATCT